METAKGKPFLEYRVGQGWKPLCEFLGKDVPEEDFPRADDWAPTKLIIAGNNLTGMIYVLPAEINFSRYIYIYIILV
jgi:sulfotransferase family protein